MGKYFKTKKQNISMPKQSLHLKKFSFVRRVNVNSNKITFEIEINDENYLNQYLAQVIYEVNKNPRVYLIKPNFYEDKLPHIYGYETIDDEKKPVLCLFYPTEWHKNLLLSETIVPWVIEWFYYYENYLITGKWLGSEHPHQRGEVKNG